MHKKIQVLENLSIGKLLFKMSLPATVGMMVMALYNVIDSIFIGHYVGALGLAAITIIFPLSILIMSFSLGFGTGAAALISLKFGEKNFNLANKIFGNFLFLITTVSIILSLFFYFFLNEILIILGSSQTILPFAKSYFSIIIFGIFFQMFSSSINNLIRSEGSAKVAMYAMLIGAIANIILDYIFIVILTKGISGAAIATVISQILSFIFSISYFIFGKSILKISFKNFFPDLKILKSIIYFGFPSFIRQSSFSLTMIVLNNFLRFYGGDLAIAAYGIMFRLMFILIMPAMGILQGSQAIIGFNYGAKKYLRVKEVLKLAIKSSSFIIFFTYLLIMIFPQIFIKMFTTNSNLILMTVYFTRIMFIFLPFIAFQIISSGFFQSIGKPKLALIITLLRQAIVFLPLLLVLPQIFGLMGIWYTYPITDFISFIITFFIFKKEYIKLQHNY